MDGAGQELPEHSAVRPPSRRLAAMAAALALAIALHLHLDARVPLHMDEFLGHHTLSCFFYPEIGAHTFGFTCRDYDLAPFSGHYLPLRAYHYVGSSHGLIYSPLFLLWRSPQSSRFFGIALLFLQAYLLSRLFRVRAAPAFILLALFMPYAYQHAIDTGPSSVELTCIFLYTFLCARWSSALRIGARSWPLAIGSGLVFFLGQWEKLSFLFLVPACLIVLAYYALLGRPAGFGRSGYLLRLIRDLCLIGFSGPLPSWLLLQAVERGGAPYLNWASGSERIGILELSEIWGRFSGYFYAFLLNPITSSHVHFHLPRFYQISWEGVALCSIALSLLALGLIEQKSNRSFPIMMSVLGFATAIFVLMSRRAWAMHHLILAYPFLLMAFFSVLPALQAKRPILLRCAFALFLAANLSLYAKIGGQPSRGELHPNLARLNELLNRYSGEYVFVSLDWGMYYIKATFGNRDQCALYMVIDQQKWVDVLKGILEKTGKKALFISLANSSSDMNLVRRSFPGLEELSLPFETGPWRVSLQR